MFKYFFIAVLVAILFHSSLSAGGKVLYNSDKSVKVDYVTKDGGFENYLISFEPAPSLPKLHMKTPIFYPQSAVGRYFEEVRRAAFIFTSEFSYVYQRYLLNAQNKWVLEIEIPFYLPDAGLQMGSGLKNRDAFRVSFAILTPMDVKAVFTPSSNAENAADGNERPPMLLTFKNDGEIECYGRPFDGKRGTYK